MQKKRDYAKEYRDFHQTPEQKKRRAQRNKERREAIREGRVQKGDNKEVHHVDANRKGKLGEKVRVVSKTTNRKKQPKRDGSED